MYIIDKYDKMQGERNKYIEDLYSIFKLVFISKLYSLAVSRNGKKSYAHD